MLHISWLKGESRWQAKIPYKNAYGLTEHILRKRGGPKVDPRLALADLIPVRDKILKELALGTEVKDLVSLAQSMTVRQWIERYLRTEIGLDERTLEGYAQLLAFAIADLGHIQLLLLTETHVRQWIVDMVERADDPEVGFGMPTVVHALKKLKTCLEVAVDRKAETGLEVNVARRLSVTKIAKRKLVNKLADYVTDPSETGRLVAACYITVDGERQLSYMAALPLLATDAGMRRSELSGLQWGDLNLDGPKPTITFKRHAVTTGKGAKRKTRLVPGTKTSQGEYATRPLSPETAQALREAKVALLKHKVRAGKKWLAGQVGRANYVIPSDPTAPGAFVFPTAQGDLYEPSSLNSWFVQTICKRAGITTKSLHSLRHDCATFLLTAGVPITVVAKHMRHSNPQITAKTYSHLIESQESLAPDTMSAIWQAVFAPAEDVAV